MRRSLAGSSNERTTDSWFVKEETRRGADMLRGDEMMRTDCGAQEISKGPLVLPATAGKVASRFAGVRARIGRAKKDHSLGEIRGGECDHHREENRSCRPEQLRRPRMVMVRILAEVGWGTDRTHSRLTLFCINYGIGSIWSPPAKRKPRRENVRSHKDLDARSDHSGSHRNRESPKAVKGANAAVHFLAVAPRAVGFQSARRSDRVAVDEQSRWCVFIRPIQWRGQRIGLRSLVRRAAEIISSTFWNREPIAGSGLHSPGPNLPGHSIDDATNPQLFVRVGHGERDLPAGLNGRSERCAFRMRCQETALISRNRAPDKRHRLRPVGEFREQRAGSSGSRRNSPLGRAHD